MASPATTTAEPLAVPTFASVSTWAYRIFGYFGLASIFASLLYGFRSNPTAPPANFGFNLALYAVFIIPHLLMTRSWWKRLLTRNPAGSPRERRFYITVSVLAWFLVLVFHRPLPGGTLALPQSWHLFETAIHFLGMSAFLLCVLLFFQGVTFSALDGLLGVPGTVSTYSHGPETPLFTDGPYSQVRHPMYRAAILAGLASLLVHPNVGQLFWISIIGATFIAFIPIEEAQMLAARGDDYRRYAERTPYRLFRGVW